MDTSQLKAHIFDYDAFPEMSDEEHELWCEDLKSIDDFSELEAAFALVGVQLEPKDVRTLTDLPPGKYSTIH